jgi:hypothetical protein
MRELLALLAKPRAKALVVTAAALRACAQTKPLATLSGHRELLWKANEGGGAGGLAEEARAHARGRY